MTHILKFTLSEKMFNEISKIAVRTKKEVPFVVKCILELLDTMIENKQMVFIQCEGRYSRISENDEKRLKMQVTIPRTIYERLKGIHCDYNTYSISQVVRQMIDFFINNRETGVIDRVIIREKDSINFPLISINNF